jgi:chromosomal replication initiator protein
MDQTKTWNKILEYIKNQVSSANFRTWFSQSILGEINEEKVIINVPSAFIKGQLIARYESLISAAIEQVLNKSLVIDFQITPQLFEKVEKEPQEDMFESDYVQTINTPTSALNPKYTLENFVVGSTNNLAYAAAQAIVQNPGTSYNPLFIYGPSGVGKTHLMQAIGNALLTRNPYFKLIYASCERFLVDYVESLQHKKTGDFRQKYRSCNVLLIDDIQFIAGKDSVQEEFFHTFNELHSKNSQIILTSDRPPNEMQRLESRLMSRFQGGLMVDIQIPDLETRIAILKEKLIEKGEYLNDEIVRMIAENTPSNTRELEGKLVQIVQIAKLTPGELTSENLSRYLGQPVKINTSVDHKKIIFEVNQYFNTKMADLTGPRRQKELVLPRQIAMFLMYEEAKLPMERIGQILGGRDHTTILHGIEKIRGALSRDMEIQKIIHELKQGIAAN